MSTQRSQTYGNAGKGSCYIDEDRDWRPQPEQPAETFVTIDDIMEACANEVHIRISREQAALRLAANNELRHPRTASQIAKDVWFEMEQCAWDDAADEVLSDDLGYDDGFVPNDDDMM